MQIPTKPEIRAPMMIQEIEAIKTMTAPETISWLGLDFDTQTFLNGLDPNLSEAEICAQFLERMIEAKKAEMRRRNVPIPKDL